MRHLHCRFGIVFLVLAFCLGCGGLTPQSGVEILSISLSPTTVTAGSTSTATVTLTQAAPVGGAAIALSSSSNVAAVPQSITVPSGATRANFSVTTTPTSSSVAVTITANYKSSQSATLTIDPGVEVSSVSLDPANVIGGNPSTGTVTLSQAAPAGGAVVTLSSSSMFAAVPANVTVPAGGTNATFSVMTTAPSAGLSVTITASYTNSESAKLAVNPVPLSLLHGTYAFSFNGLAQNQATALFLSGSFAADGQGHITSGVEDLNEHFVGNQDSGDSISEDAGLTGSYVVGNDGRGMLSFNVNGRSQQFAFVIESGHHGQLIWFDNTATGSGTFDLQTQSDFSANIFHGSWAFHWAGIDRNGHTTKAVGGFAFSGGGIQGLADRQNVASGFSELNVLGNFAPPDSNGHGIARINYGTQRIVYAYEIISSSRILLIEFDGKGGAIGEADLQTKSFSASDLSGDFVFSLTDIDGKIRTSAAIGGQFTADGASSISGDATENIGGQFVVGKPLSGSFTFANSGSSTNFNGRGEMTLNLPDHAGGNTFVFYMVSPSQAFVMENDSVQLTTGVFLNQTGGPFTAASLAGDYGLEFSGNEGSVRVDLSGQFTAGGTSTLPAGALDLNLEYLPSAPFVFSNIPISNGRYTIADGKAGSGTITFKCAGASFGFTFYFVSPTQILLIETDQVFISTGISEIQPIVP
ncbi:MAG: hypothetical protein WBC04_16795 [Candidatus Acidiferrales bacterium]